MVFRGRWTSVGGKQVAEVLVKWKDLPDWEATWELLEVFQAQFPHYNLGNKVVFEGGGLL